MPELSILIPARNEIFLSKTIENILENIEGDTEIIVVCDGNWPDPSVNDHPKVTLIYHSESIGQRAATNEAARISRAKYVMKVDAHCSFDKGFDVKLIKDMQPDWTVVPIMRNLHAFDWVCPDGHRRYQSPSGPCTVCGKPTKMDVVWVGKGNPQSTSYCFDSEPHFQYFREYKGREKGNLTETMSLQGSCWMMERERYWEIEVCDESLGSWGSQGIEVACKSWLSGGRVICNHRTWYAHMFRTQGGDFGFPYHLSGKQTEGAKRKARELFFNNAWSKQKYPLSWLLEKFWPVPGWSEKQLKEIKERDHRVENPETEVEQIKKAQVVSSHAPTKLTKGLLYYTDNRCSGEIMAAVQRQLKRCSNGFPIVSVSLRPIDFGENIVLDLERGYLTMNKQQLAGLEALKTDIVFFVEHDILYPKCHFDFTPPMEDCFYYNLNWWKVRVEDGQALHFKAKQVSGLCAYRETLIEYFRDRVQKIESGEIGGRRSFEPGTQRHDEYGKISKHGFEIWFSDIPYVDIRHKTCLTRNIFDPSGYRNQVVGWTMADEIPGWGKTKGRFFQFLEEAVGDAVQETPAGE